MLTELIENSGMSRAAIAARFRIAESRIASWNP